MSNLSMTNSTVSGKNHFTLDAFAEMTERMREKKYQNCSELSSGLQKTFDAIDHGLLLRNLELYGLRINCYN